MIQSFHDEQWKPIRMEGLENVYEISSCGRLKSFKTHTDGALLKGSVVQGYKAFITRLQDGKSCTRYIHRLVAEAFLEKPDPACKYVIHLDYDKQNNHMRNLRWVSKEEKEKHQAKGPNIRKGIITNSKLTVAKVKLIKRLLKRSNTRLKMIAKQFGITHTQLNRIRKGENWGHVSPE